MRKTENYGLNKPEQDGFYDVDEFNESMDILDEELKKCSDLARSPMEADTVFEMASVRENITSGEKLKIILGKITRFFEDLKTVAFTGNYNDLSNKPPIPSIPGSIKNPFSFNANGKSYDGSTEVNMGTLGVAYGGTGAETAEAARTNMGLKAAATQNVANNCTTTEEGSVLDARQGKELREDIEQLNSNISFPDGTGFYPDIKDGVAGYNTDPQRGADTFIPFSSKSSGKIPIYQSGNSLDMKKYVPKEVYNKLTTSNFICATGTFNANARYPYAKGERNVDIYTRASISYNPSTSIATGTVGSVFGEFGGNSQCTVTLSGSVSGILYLGNI